MPELYRSPLAIRQLLAQGSSILLALVGVGVAILLMFMQLGFRDALLRSVVRSHSALAGELVIASPLLESIGTATWFPAQLLDIVRGHPAVAEVRTLALNQLSIRELGTGKLRNIMIFAIDPRRPALIGLPGLAESAPLLLASGSALFDRESRLRFGDVLTPLSHGRNVTMVLPSYGEKPGPEIDVVGLFSLGATLLSDGNLVVSDTTFARIAGIPTGRPTLGAIMLRRGASPEATARELQAMLGSAARVYTKAGFIAHEQEFWETQTPIGFVFDLGLIVGGGIAMVFVYQILHGNIARNLSDYAILKSMGFPHSFFVVLVLETGVVIGVASFVPAIVASVPLYAAAQIYGNIDMSLNLPDALLILLLVVVMSVVAGLIALRKLREADPVMLFS